MDLLQEFERKSSVLSEEAVYDGIQAVIRHIQTAERYLARAREENDEDLFNDVIYRTNQAFEGILKEAYTTLTGQDGSQLTPHRIEQHLLAQQVFTSRVLELFTNYRRQWRNPSTHDHTLLFSEQEALLAIASVSAFATILADQMIEAVSFRRERDKIEGNEQALTQITREYDTLPLSEQVLHVIRGFSGQVGHSEEDLGKTGEAQILGRLTAFISYVDPSIRVKRGQRIADSPHLTPDLTLTKGDETVLVEVKRPGSSKRRLDQAAQLQMFSYLDAGHYDRGIVYLAPPYPTREMKINKAIHEMRDREIIVYTLTPHDV